MQARRNFRTAGACALVVWFAGAAAGAQPNPGAFRHRVPFDLFGVQENFACGGAPQGACGAVASVNSFIYLQRRFPGRYGDVLVPNYDPIANTSMEDAADFGVGGWQVGGNPMRKGYYSRFADNPNFDAELDFLQTKVEWVNDHAPRTTRFRSWFDGSPHFDRAPTILDLAEQIDDGEDVEFFVLGGDFFHVMLLTEVACDAEMRCSIRYQDPNDPTVNQPSTPLTVTDGMLQFTGVPGSGFEGTVTITAAFSESAVPEPGTWVLMAVGLVGLGGYEWRRRRREDRRA